MQIREEVGPLRRRAVLLLVAIFIALGLLHLRLVHLQLVNGAYWRRMSENNRLRTLPLESFRGRIYDRRGHLLATNVPSWELLFFPDETRHPDTTVLFLARMGFGRADELHQRIRDRPAGQLAPIVVAEDLSWSQVARIRSHQSDFPELSVVRRFRRHYPHGTSVAHAIGYLRAATEADLEADPDLKLTSLVGATGVEASHQEVLAGREGERWLVVSAVGRQLGVVRESPADPGADLSLTLDLRLQEAAARALGEHAGAVVALDPRTGAVRAMYSAPSFDSNVFVGRLTSAQWRTLRDDPLHPLQNRCIQGTYPPGSTIKPFFALAGLTDELITPSWGVTCSGSVTLYHHPFRCWQRWGHGRVGLIRSLEVSCDTYYYLLGQRLGIETMAAWMRRFGFGAPSGGGFPTERAGVIGTPEWKMRVRNEPWYPGEAVSVSIGQGPVDVTALQVARGYAALANGGRLVTPHLVQDASLPEPVDLGLDQEYLKLVVEGLRLVVHGSEGTARSLAPLPVVGKTGTAQVASLVEGQTVQEMERRLRHHAWFAGWGPIDEPRIVVAVLVEHGGGGGSVAAPVAGPILRAALEGEGVPVPASWSQGGSGEVPAATASDEAPPERPGPD
jgi:penicillin-binding protein 2